MPDIATYPFDLGLISATPEEFDWQMGYVAKEFDPVPLSAVEKHLRGRGRLPRRALVVTFDDGYADNHEFATPILRRHSIPATVFATAGHIGEEGLLWHDLAVYLAVRIHSGALPVAGGSVELRPTDSTELRRELASRFIRHLKTMRHAEAMSLLDGLREHHKERLQPSDFGQARLLSWDALREMSQGGGWEVGSHTLSHAILAKVDRSQLTQEIRGSKELLERQLGIACDCIAYPVGRSFAYNDSVQVEVGLAGYRVGIAYDAGVNSSDALDRFALRRQSVEHDMDRDYFKALVKLPRWFH